MEIKHATVLAFSGAGTTALISKRFADALGVKAEVVDVTPASAQLDLSFGADELVVFAAPSFGGRVPAPAVERFRACTGEATAAALIVTYGNRAIDDTLAELYDIALEGGFVPVAAASFVAHHSLMTDAAQGRPDESDLAAVETFARDTMVKLSDSPAPSPLDPDGVPGKRPYCDFDGVPFKAVSDADACTQCGTCAEECPVGAIPEDDPTQTDREKCIACMRCVAACPAHARMASGGEKLAAISKGFAAKFSARQEPAIYL